MKALTREQIREIDHRALEEFGIPGVVLMENAGRNAAQLIMQQAAAGSPPTACIFCGGGNNGGDGFVIARHLVNARWRVQIILLVDAAGLPPDAKVNYEIARRMSIPIHVFDHRAAQRIVSGSAVIVDALLGTGFSGEVRSPLDEAIGLINSAAHALKVAVDVPSGLDCNTGQPTAATVRADLTITFVAPKVGFERATEYTGKVLVADIGAPRLLWDAA